MLVAGLASCSSNKNGSGPVASAYRSAISSAPSGAAAAVRPSAGCTPATSSGPSSAANTPQTITVDGTARTYRIAVPATTTPAPLIVLLHGLGQSGEVIDQATDLPARGTAAGAIVVSPDATGTPALWRPARQGPDADLLTALIGDVEAHHCVDTARVGIAGFSVGALLAIAYGCAHQDTIAAIVTAELEPPGSCSEPMSILAFHATGDPIVAYTPAPGKAPLGGGSGTDANMARWAAISHCAATPTTTPVNNVTTRIEWQSCAGGSDVILYKIAGGGHNWPTSQEVDATKATIDFLTGHRLRAS